MLPGSGRSPGAAALPPRAGVLTLFFLSGAVALVQEVTWSQVLARTLGHGTAAVSIVAAVFLAGLALGAVWGGRRADSTGAPLRLYGWLEIGVGVLSLALVFLLPRLPWITAPLGVVVLDAGWLGTLARATAAAFCLLPVTFLMGASLPPLVGWSATGPRAVGLETARLAGVNAAGGALGALSAVFVLLPRLGTGMTLLAAAATSAAVGGTALALARRHPRGAGAPTRRDDMPGPPPSDLLRHGLPVLLVLAGIASLAAQIAWIRVFSWMIGPSVYAFGILLAVVVGGMAAGGMAIARRAGDTGQPLRLFAGIEIALGFSVVLTAWAVPLLPVWIARLSAATHHRPALLQTGEALTALALLAVPTVLLGAAFPLVCRLLVPGRVASRGVGAGSALVTAGNVIGALAAGFVLPHWIGSRGVLIAAGLILAGVGCGVLVLETSRARHGVLAAVASVALLAVLATPAWDPALLASGPALNGPAYVAAARSTGQEIDSVMRARGPLLFRAEGPDALVTVRGLPDGGASLQINGKTEASTGGDLRAQILAGQVPLLHVAQPRKVLVIGLASGVTAGSLLTRNPDELVVVEVSPTSVDAARVAPFAAISGQPLDDPRTRVVIADARSLLIHDTDRYDVIASQPSNPWVPGVAALYTVEFFRLARARLRPGGVFGQWVQAYGLSPGDFRRVLRTFAAVFPHCALYEEAVGGGDYFLVGSNDSLVTDAARLAERLTPAVRADLGRAGVDGPAALLAHQVLDRAGIVAFAAGGEILTDDRLRLAFTAPLTIWLKTNRALAARLETFRHPPAGLLTLDRLSPESRRRLLADLARRERERDQDWQFLQLLDEGPVRLADPSVIEATALARSGRFAAAYGLLADALGDAPGPAALQVLAGDLAARLGETELAILHYRTALAAQPGSRAAQLGLALVLATASPGQARPLLESVLDERPGLPLALVALGAVHLRARRAAEALPLLQAATHAAPDWAVTWSNLGVAHRHLGHPREAEAAYRRALALQPGLSQAWYNLGVLLRQRDDEPAALAAFLKGVVAAPDDCDLRNAVAVSPLPAANLPPAPFDCPDGSRLRPATPEVAGTE